MGLNSGGIHFIVSRKILIVTATDIEAQVFEGLKPPAEGISIEFLVTGVGTMACSRALTRYFLRNDRPELALQAGIAGSYNSNIPIGSAEIIKRDCFADFGIDNRGRFIPAVEAGLVGDDAFVFTGGGWIECNNDFIGQLEGKSHFLTAVTSDTVSGSAERIAVLKNRYNPDIESMEGATFFYICALEKVPFIAVRAVSNMVEERDRDRWDIPLALRNLREKTEGLLTLFFTGK